MIPTEMPAERLRISDRALQDAAEGTGIVVHECVAAGWSWRNPVVPVTVRDGYLVTDFGTRRGDADLADEWTGFGICQQPAVVELAAARQVVAYDPEFGRNDRLWPMLAEFAHKAVP